MSLFQWDFDVILRESSDKDSTALGILPVDDPTKSASHGNMLYPADSLYRAV